jgi:hypothetical protein
MTASASVERRGPAVYTAQPRLAPHLNAPLTAAIHTVGEARGVQVRARREADVAFKCVCLIVRLT